jgi:hypothetical protein
VTLDDILFILETLAGAVLALVAFFLLWYFVLRRYE